jgi:hypothetical protein
MTSTQHRPTRSAGIAGAALLLAVAAAGPAFAADGHETGKRTETGKPTGHNPPGNNGTVFIHDVGGDHAPHNVPHVSCEFWVDLFGFDAAQEVTVGFAGQAPTGKDIPLDGTWTGQASDDAAGGAGNDFDLELTFTADDLGVTALGTPHPKQGYHVKMTVETGEPGGHKYKVFWIEPCASEQAPTDQTSTGQTPIDSAPQDESSSGTDTQDATTRVHPSKPLGRSVTRQPTTDTPEVLGAHLTRTQPSRAGASGGMLPYTGPGAPVALLTWAAAGALGVGAALTAAARRRTDAA